MRWLLALCLVTAADDVAACVCRAPVVLAPDRTALDVPIDAEIYFSGVACDDPRLLVTDDTVGIVAGRFSFFSRDVCRFAPDQLWRPQTTVHLLQLRVPPDELSVIEQLEQGLDDEITVFTTGEARGTPDPEPPFATVSSLRLRASSSDCDAPGGSTFTATFDVFAATPLIVVDIDGAGGASPFEDGAAFFVVQRDVGRTQPVAGNASCALPWDVPFGASSSFRFGAVDNGKFSGWSEPLVVDVPPALEEGEEGEEGEGEGEGEAPGPWGCSGGGAPVVVVLLLLLVSRLRRRARSQVP